MAIHGEGIMLIAYRISSILRMDLLQCLCCRSLYDWIMPSHTRPTQPILLRYCIVSVSRSQTIRANVVAHSLRRTFQYDHLYYQLPVLIVLRVKCVSARVRFPLDPIDITPNQLFITRGAGTFVGATESEHDITPSKGLRTPPVYNTVVSIYVSNIPNQDLVFQLVSKLLHCHHHHMSTVYSGFLGSLLCWRVPSDLSRYQWAPERKQWCCRVNRRACHDFDICPGLQPRLP